MTIPPEREWVCFTLEQASGPAVPVPGCVLRVAGLGRGRLSTNLRPGPVPRFVGQDGLNPPNLAVIEPHLDPAGVVSGRRQDVSYHAADPSSRALVLLEDNFYAHPLTEVISSSAVHSSLPPAVGHALEQTGAESRSKCGNGHSAQCASFEAPDGSLTNKKANPSVPPPILPQGLSSCVPRLLRPSDPLRQPASNPRQPVGADLSRGTRERIGSHDSQSAPSNETRHPESGARNVVIGFGGAFVEAVYGRTHLGGDHADESVVMRTRQPGKDENRSWSSLAGGRSGKGEELRYCLARSTPRFPEGKVGPLLGLHASQCPLNRPRLPALVLTACLRSRVVDEIQHLCLSRCRYGSSPSANFVSCVHDSLFVPQQHLTPAGPATGGRQEGMLRRFTRQALGILAKRNRTQPGTISGGQTLQSSGVGGKPRGPDGGLR